MPKQTALEEKHRLLKRLLHQNLEKKHSIEITISKQWKELKKIEIALEKIQESSDIGNALPIHLAAEGLTETF